MTGCSHSPTLARARPLPSSKPPLVRTPTRVDFPLSTFPMTSVAIVSLHFHSGSQTDSEYLPRSSPSQAAATVTSFMWSSTQSSVISSILGILDLTSSLKPLQDCYTLHPRQANSELHALHRQCKNKKEAGSLRDLQGNQRAFKRYELDDAVLSSLA